LNLRVNIQFSVKTANNYNYHDKNDFENHFEIANSMNEKQNLFETKYFFLEENVKRDNSFQNNSNKMNIEDNSYIKQDLSKRKQNEKDIISPKLQLNFKPKLKIENTDKNYSDGENKTQTISQIDNSITDKSSDNISNMSIENQNNYDMNLLKHKEFFLSQNIDKNKNHDEKVISLDLNNIEIFNMKCKSSKNKSHSTENFESMENSHENQKSFFNKFFSNKYSYDEYEENLFISEDERAKIKQEKLANKKLDSICNNIISNDLIQKTQCKKFPFKSNKNFEEEKQIKTIKNSNSEIKMELKTFDKTRFSDMKILGQFNKGFIIALLKDELFIIDQHAADEKFNYENLISNAKIVKQPLILPLPIINLSLAEKITAYENRHLFSNLGFDIKLQNDNAEKLVTLTIPTIYNYRFKNDDFSSIYRKVEIEKTKFDFKKKIEEEMDENEIYNKENKNNYSNINILISEPVLHHIATKACRSSIMVGHSLDLKKMKNIINNLEKCLSPWNCPHGRPTIRFLKKV